jgi:phosphomannomutase
LKQNARGVDPMNDLFGTDGIRGRAFEPPLDEDTVRRLGAALADILNGAG